MTDKLVTDVFVFSLKGSVRGTLLIACILVINLKI